MGLRWNEYVEGSTNIKNGIRIDKGNPKIDGVQSVDHIRITVNGKVIARDGRVITTDEYSQPSTHPDAHIPLTEWIKWKQWNKP